MINYVQKKRINYKEIRKLLSVSEEAHTFTNNGPLKNQLETDLSKLLGLRGRRIVCTSSGTSALHLLMHYFDSKASTPLRWVTTAFNFPSPVVNRLQTTVIDITKNSITETYGVELAALHQFDGVIIPTLFGSTAHLEDVHNFCQEYGKKLIVDNASSPLSQTAKGINVNNFGNACIGSLHHTKYLGFGEGGFAVVPNADYEAFQPLANFGFTDNREHSPYANNAKMSEVAAAFILNHIRKYDVDRHKAIQTKMVGAIDQIAGARLLNYSEGVIYGNLPLVFDHPVSHLTFRDVGIEANKYYKPLAPLPNSLDLFDRIVNLPLHSKLSNYDIELMLRKIENTT